MSIEPGEASVASVLTALAANATIASAKGAAAVLTGSPALLAETLHTLADTGNEVLLWIALRRSRRAPDPSHPLGYGPERYYWALLAAIGMFLVGGAVSVWEGVRALVEPRSLETFWVGVAVLLIALALDGYSRLVAARQLRREAGSRGVTVRELLRESADPTVVTIYLEDSIDVLGAALALVALVLHRVTGSALPDALTTIVIGLLLGYVAVKLTRRNRQLLSNQGIPARYVDELREHIGSAPGVRAVDRLEAIYLGPREILVAADVQMDPDLGGAALAGTLARIRADAKRDIPVIARLYLTPVPLVERGTDDAGDVHLRAADALGDLDLTQVVLEAQAQDLAPAVVQDRGHALDRGPGLRPIVPGVVRVRAGETGSDRGPDEERAALLPAQVGGAGAARLSR